MRSMALLDDDSFVGDHCDLRVAIGGEDVVVPVSFTSAEIILPPYDDDDTFVIGIWVNMTAEQVRAHYPHVLEVWNERHAERH
jgi:hypothetical protein